MTQSTKLTELLKSPYYRDIYKVLVSEMSAQGLAVRQEDAPLIAKIGAQTRAGMSWELLGIMLGVNKNTFQRWVLNEKPDKGRKIRNCFSKW